ncbi:Wzz/FepE/Etk N-terminal domain-containing protein [Streptomyces sp. NPDC048506]|uniref:YveK family protein n=1 Tax=Streptomyces sp. NPDC048506 TaxID=3155028 RepID=UPI00341BC253
MATTEQDLPGRTGRPPSGLRPRLRRLPSWWPLPLCALLGAVGGAAYGLLAPPQYAATAYVLVVPAKDADPATALGFAQAYGRIATGGAVLAEAHRASGLPLGALRGGVRAMTSPDAPMIEITGTARDPRTSAGLADAVARALARTGKETTPRTGARPLFLSPATVPADPVSASVPLSTGVGGCAGGLLGGLLLLVRPRGTGLRAAGQGGVLPAPAHCAVAAGAVPAAEDSLR